MCSLYKNKTDKRNGRKSRDAPEINLNGICCQKKIDFEELCFFLGGGVYNAVHSFENQSIPLSGLHGIICQKVEPLITTTV
jgi:hypothetical protein